MANLKFKVEALRTLASPYRKGEKDENKKIYTVCRDRWFSGDVFRMRTKDRQRGNFPGCKRTGRYKR